MKSDSLVALLGRRATEPDVEASLIHFGIRKRPAVRQDEDDPDGALEIQDWLLSSSNGIEFGFEDEAAFNGAEPDTWGTAAMLLTQIYLYGDHSGVRPYGHELPFGLALGDQRASVLSKMSDYEDVRRSYVRDTWELDRFRMIVSYSANGSIAFVLCMLRLPSLPPPEDVAGTAPTLETLLDLLGTPWYAPELRLALGPLVQAPGFQDVKRARVADFHASHGFELGFREPLGREDGSARGYVLTQVVLYREREMEARGWNGNLPMGILFDDSPETVIAKVGRPPDEQRDQTFSGYALWHLQQYTLHVFYSTMENYVRRVRVIAPGVWDADRAG